LPEIINQLIYTNWRSPVMLADKSTDALQLRQVPSAQALAPQASL